MQHANPSRAKTPTCSHQSEPRWCVPALLDRAPQYQLDNGAYVWELIVASKKLGLIGVRAFVTDPYVEAVWAVGIILLYLVSILEYRPLVLPGLMRLEVSSSVLQIALMLSLLLYNQPQASNELTSALLVFAILQYVVVACMTTSRRVRAALAWAGSAVTTQASRLLQRLSAKAPGAHHDAVSEIPSPSSEWVRTNPLGHTGHRAAKHAPGHQ